MKIEHIAIWTKNLELIKEFYVTYFGATAGSKYVNPEKNFESYFLNFSSGARLELMQSPRVAHLNHNLEIEPVGYAHLAFSVGSKGKVERLTSQLRDVGFKVVSIPRYTGDGYFESVVLDPDGNRIEIAI